MQPIKESRDRFHLIKPYDDLIIHTNHVEKRFGREYAVRDVTFDVSRNKIFGFVGPSGSGKTTTIRMLTGFYEPTKGEIAVFNQSPMKFDQKMRQKIGYLPQLFALYPNLSVWENMNFIASIYGISLFGERSKKLDHLLDLVELREHKSKLARDISGGMQRRLSLAATLIHDPELVFLDEPTAGVDPMLRHKLWSHFRDLKSAGRTLFITTQYVSEAAYCDVVGVIHGGKLLFVDSPDGLRRTAFGGDLLDLHTVDPLQYELMPELNALPCIERETVRVSDTQLRLTVNQAHTSIPRLLNWCSERDVSIQSVEEYLPSFDDVFVQLIESRGKDG